jgi:uncharacterized protein
MTAALAGMGGYALAEPFRLTVKPYRFAPPHWPQGVTLRVAVLADLHACDPWMTGERIANIVEQTNRLKPDVVLLLGDFVVGYRLSTLGRKLKTDEWSKPLAGLEAPLGCYTVLGNHDWWDDHAIQDRRTGRPRIWPVLESAGLTVLQNDVVQVRKDGKSIWIAGLGDQWAFWPRDRRWRGRREIPYEGVDDLPATLEKVTDDGPVILMAHEPDIFPKVPDRVSLTLSGHTHGGQVRLFGFAPIVPSRYGRRYTYGHVVENKRNLIVSGGLGCSGLPVRFGSPPEVVLLELGAVA